MDIHLLNINEKTFHHKCKKEVPAWQMPQVAKSGKKRRKREEKMDVFKFTVLSFQKN